MAEIGLAEGICPICGRRWRAPRPADIVICDCYRFCPLCSPSYAVPMMSYTPDLELSMYGIEPDFEKTIDILHVCNNHSPPYYSRQKPVEVKLT